MDGYPDKARGRWVACLEAVAGTNCRPAFERPIFVYRNDMRRIGTARTRSASAMPGKADQVTALLAELSASDRTATGALMPLVYDELRMLAQRQLRGQRPGHTLNTTALVHEAYLKLVNQKAASWQNRAHFLSVAAIAMRQILINYAHSRRAQKRGGGQVVVTFDESLVDTGDGQFEHLIALDEALKRLSAISERQGNVVAYRFFGGLTHDEIAAVLDVSEPTVRRDWRIARAWLTRELAADS